ncbi:MAG: aldo/keto reductase [Nitrososphaerota archaeon]|jgi:aryl-alcohol dehydrogenase (NADP+)|nr:aldo/keto reductase [Nitrososphaerota archaeon]
MEYLRLGTSGMKVSRLCLGCMSFGGAEVGNFGWTLGYKESEKIINRAIDLGINFFDTADYYSEGRSEQILGKAISGRRDQLVIATKVFFPMGEGVNNSGLSRKHVRMAVKASLERLGTSYIDLYQIHRLDTNTPMKEIISTLDDLIHQDGTVNYIGASSMWAWQFEKLLRLSDEFGFERFISMQNHYNLLYREEEREMVPLCLEEGIGIIPWSPLARGFLSGKYKEGKKPTGLRYEKDRYLSQRYFKPQDFRIVDRVVSLAHDKCVKPAQLALAWLLNKPGVVSPIIGVTKIQQLDELVESLEVKISSSEMAYLEELYEPKRVEGHT